MQAVEKFQPTRIVELGLFAAVQAVEKSRMSLISATLGFAAVQAVEKLMQRMGWIKRRVCRRAGG